MLSTYYTTLLLGPCYIVKVIAALIAANSQKKKKFMWRILTIAKKLYQSISVWIRTNKAVRCTYLPISNKCVKLKMGLLLLIFQSSTNVNYITVFVAYSSRSQFWHLHALVLSFFILLQTNCHHARPIYQNRQHTIYMKIFSDKE